jgi:hypothetical protein
MRRSGVVLAAVALVVVASTTFAADEESGPGWQFEFMPYAWIPGTFGTVQVRGRTAHVDTTLGDVFTLLWHGDAFTIGGYFAARYDRWSFFTDAYGGFLDQSVSETIPTRFPRVQLHVGATLKLNPVITDFAFGYDFARWAVPERQRPISLGVYLGTRYLHLGQELDASVSINNRSGRSASASSVINSADPMIGIRWEVPVLDSLSLDFRGDIGGLPTNDKLTWGIVGDARYWLGWEPFGARTWLEAGYRIVAYQRDFGGGNNLNLQLRGPLVALGFQF